MKMREVGYLSFLVAALAVVGSPWVSASVILIGSHNDHSPHEPFGVRVEEKDAAPVDFLMDFQDRVFEPKEIVVSPVGDYYVMDGTGVGDTINAEAGGGTVPASAPIVHRFNANGGYNGAFIARAVYGPVDYTDTADENEPMFMAIHPLNGFLYMGTEGGYVQRFNAVTGDYVDTILAPGDGTTGYELNETSTIAFDTAGNLFVSGSWSGGPHTDAILRFSSVGAFMSVVLDDATAPLNESKGLVFRDGLLYVSNDDDDNILVVSFNPDGSTNSVDILVPAGDNGMVEPVRIAFGPDGLLYVTGGEEGLELFRYQTDGTFVDKFVDVGDGSGKFHDSWGFLFVGLGPEEVEVPLLSPFSIALLALLLVGGAWVVVRRRSGGVSA